MLRAYKYRIYPTAEQRQYLAKVFGCVRFIYNKMLAKSRPKLLFAIRKYFEALFVTLKDRRACFRVRIVVINCLFDRINFAQHQFRVSMRYYLLV